jgi:hypothetical protein
MTAHTPLPLLAEARSRQAAKGDHKTKPLHSSNTPSNDFRLWMKWTAGYLPTILAGWPASVICEFTWQKTRTTHLAHLHLRPSSSWLQWVSAGIPPDCPSSGDYLDIVIVIG